MGMEWPLQDMDLDDSIWKQYTAHKTMSLFNQKQGKPEHYIWTQLGCSSYQKAKVNADSQPP